MSQVLKGISILIISTNPNVPTDFASASVQIVKTTKSAISSINKHPFDVVIADIELVNDALVKAISRVKATKPSALFYIMVQEDFETVESSNADAVTVVDDFIKKPLDTQRLSAVIATALGRPPSGTSLTTVEPIITKVKPYFIFRSPVMKQALKDLPEIARTNQTVLITGETGTGKELVARAIHLMSPRYTEAFVPVNCGAIPESLIEGELFGHEKGAFTGAIKDKKGKFELAHGGTLFLDEIGDMPLSLQVRLLRALEDSQIYRLGSERAISVDVRVISATRVDLSKAVQEGLFREDLYYRLNVLRIHLPPLRERKEDIALLALHFLHKAYIELGKPLPLPELSSETIRLLESLHYKGNVRELRNLMTRVATLLPNDVKKVFPMHIIPYIDEFERQALSSTRHKEGFCIPENITLRELQRLYIEHVLSSTRGNKTKAAKVLGISVRHLRRLVN